MRTLRTRACAAAKETKGREVSFCTLGDRFIDYQKAKGNAVQTIKHYEQSIQKIKLFLAYYDLGPWVYQQTSREEAILRGGEAQCSVFDEYGIDSE